MKPKELNLLEHRAEKLKGEKMPKVRGRKFHGIPYLHLKKIRVSSRQKIRQLLSAGVSLEELKSLGLAGKNSES